MYACVCLTLNAGNIRGQIIITATKIFGYAQFILCYYLVVPPTYMVLLLPSFLGAGQLVCSNNS